MTKKAETKLDVTGFDGVVVTHDWVRMPDGHQYIGFRGKVRIMSADEAVGWTPTGHNSANWLARIEGPTMSINMMGCQVKVVLEGAVPANYNHDTFIVP